MSLDFKAVTAWKRAAGFSSAMAVSTVMAFAANDLPPPKAGGDVMPPVELAISGKAGSISCAPQELRLPAESNVAMSVSNQSDSQVTITAPQIFENKNVLHHQGDVVHVASNNGYLVKANGKGEIQFRTIAAGQYAYECTGVNDRSEPFKGALTLVDPTK
jgi:hypothetical protein